VLFVADLAQEQPKIKSGVIISIAKNNATERKFRPFLEFSILYKR
jgi:hypothetical protein